MISNSEENKIHLAFEVSILLKGIHAFVEIVGGILIFLITKSYVVGTVLSFTQEELSEDPRDVLSHYLITASSNFSVSSQHFVALYLLSHGVIKLFLVINLYRKNLWAYPTSIVVFSLFIIYQLSRYTSTHSLWLLVFTVFDVIVILLTAHEWRRVRLNKSL